MADLLDEHDTRLWRVLMSLCGAGARTTGVPSGGLRRTSLSSIVTIGTPVADLVVGSMRSVSGARAPLRDQCAG
jgi:hypothetical protein